MRLTDHPAQARFAPTAGRKRLRWPLPHDLRSSHCPGGPCACPRTGERARMWCPGPSAVTTSFGGEEGPPCGWRPGSPDGRWGRCRASRADAPGCRPAVRPTSARGLERPSASHTRHRSPVRAQGQECSTCGVSSASDRPAHLSGHGRPPIALSSGSCSPRLEHSTLRRCNPRSRQAQQRHQRAGSAHAAPFQRASKDAIKRARFLALMPYVGE
jgi:hypothetical protein